VVKTDVTWVLFLLTNTVKTDGMSRVVFVDKDCKNRWDVSVVFANEYWKNSEEMECAQEYLYVRKEDRVFFLTKRQPTEPHLRKVLCSVPKLTLVCVSKLFKATALANNSFFLATVNVFCLLFTVVESVQWLGTKYYSPMQSLPIHFQTNQTSFKKLFSTCFSSSLEKRCLNDLLVKTRARKRKIFVDAALLSHSTSKT
jgi:hypothetical protein